MANNGFTVEIPVVEVIGEGDFEELVLPKGSWVLKVETSNFNVSVFLSQGGDFRYGANQQEIFLNAPQDDTTFYLQATTHLTNPQQTINASVNNCIGSKPFFFSVGGGNSLPSTITAQELQADFGGAFSVFPSKIFLGGISTRLEITEQNTETLMKLDKVVDDSLSIYDANTGIFDLTKISQGGSPFVNFSSTMLLSTSSQSNLGKFTLILRPVGYDFNIGNPPNTLKFPNPTLISNASPTTISLQNGFFASQLMISGLLPRAKYKLLVYRQNLASTLRVEGILAPCYVAISGI